MQIARWSVREEKKRTFNSLFSESTTYSLILSFLLFNYIENPCPRFNELFWTFVWINKRKIVYI